MKIYLLPGLGFDHRIFQHLDLAEYNCTYMDWIEPKPKEPITSYASRLAQSITETNERIVLIGQSLGGILSQEIAAIRPVDQVILISSIRSRKELPLIFKLVEPLRIYRFFTKTGGIKTIHYWGPWFDYTTLKEQDLFKDMIGKQSNRYLQWALRTLSNWQTPTIRSTTHVYQIHGDKERTFPIALVPNADYIIKGGGHFMVYKHGDLITKRIKEIITV